MSAAIFFMLLTAFFTFVSFAEGEDRERRSTVCYGDLGCFSTGGAFTSLHRPLNLNPDSPAEINTRFLLFTRQNPHDRDYELLNANNFQSISSSNFRSSRQTKVIIHGFLENGFADWMMEIKDELIKYDDYNVISVDWGGGSKIPYTQATANTRVVGAELAKLISVLKSQTAAQAEDFHLIGHSLGAHICGYAGERTPNLGRISGLDPADPYFQYTDKTVRLDPTDANFVDVMHTNGASVLTGRGYGMEQACGHVDYFPNGGLHQPGCSSSAIDTILTEGDIFNGAKLIVACSHMRAHYYFKESINSVCPFTGYRCNSYADFERGMCLPCSGANCGYMGFHADKTKPPAGQTHVKYFLDTGKAGPFCRYHYQVDVQFGQLPGSSSEKGTLYMNIYGANGQLGEQQLNEDSITIQPGHIYGFMVTSKHDIGDTTRVTFRWDLDSHWYNPLTWGFLSSHALHVDWVDIVSGETAARKRFCGQTSEVKNDVQTTFSTDC